ncbi:ABC transporter ATP-binding protein [Adlercreutzia sp. ZJ138]|uniref:ABC transporter ATP-binding protein n=1 Tax=Adlercreutzia sp. ZJ138 TaxID=2709405 RepID=UPI0013EDD513|nr:ABC transporter ATP-binding protein [Adlercreutzia sp. ZJ138]
MNNSLKSGNATACGNATGGSTAACGNATGGNAASAAPIPPSVTGAYAAPSAEAPVLDVRNITKRYGARFGRKHGGNNQESATMALDGVSLTVVRGEFTGIMGPSGSGKSTLLNCISTIDRVTQGQIIINGTDITSMDSRRVAAFRRDELGFVFQDSNLLDTLTCFENIALSLTIKHTPAREITQHVQAVAATLDIADVLDKYPYQISGGQKQRVAAARATVGSPHLILADEPTGALDSKSAAQLLRTFELMNARGATLLMVTHDPMSASYCTRIVFIKDGKLWGQIERKGKSRGEFYRDIVNVTAKLGGEADYVR